MNVMLKTENISERTYPLIPLRNVVPFPRVDMHVVFGRSKTRTAIKTAFDTDKMVVLAAQKNPKVDDPDMSGVYRIGVLGRIEQLFQVDGAVHALIVGVKRIRINELTNSEPFMKVSVNELDEIVEKDDDLKVISGYIARELQKAFSLGKGVDSMILMKVAAGMTARDLSDQAAFYLDISMAEKQKILETLSIKSRLSKVAKVLEKEIKILQLERSIESKTQTKFEKNMRRTVLEEKKRTIEKELEGLGVKQDGETAELREKIKKAKMPKDTEKKSLDELKRLAQMPSIAPEASYIRSYIDWLVQMPWSKKSPNNVSIKKAAKVLNGDHYGLVQAKERVLEYLSVMKLRKQASKKEKKPDLAASSNILCFIGPPGVGKTSIGKSIAKSIGREFVRISLGGVRDEAEIRGHRRTYVGALPGRIIQGIKTAGTKNPVFMLDEIDKLGSDFRGDPSAALLEALDPEQNKEFSDHYLEVPFDLSDVFFIVTGNVLETIPPALKDRLEIIRFSGYTHDEKLEIAKKYLVSKQTTQNGLDPKKVKFTDKGLMEIIRKYTREAGVRELERMIANVCRKIARRVAEGKRIPKTINEKNIRIFLKTAQYSDTARNRKDEVGVSTGMAWTQAGGDILFVETVLMPGNGKIYFTGKLGKVMKESCQAAVSYLRSHWKEYGIRKDFTKDTDIHVHVPEGAVPKDGPSAGVAITIALLSSLTKRKIKSDVAMTGEITLRGKVLEVGGVKEKVIAAHRAGLKKIILPKANKKNLEDIPAKVKKDLQINFAESLDQVVKVAVC
jgi:ATP-dependent Lon protease